jgi:hypothetical protein
VREGVTDVSENSNSRINSPFLMQNYPNPFNPVTTINYQISETSLVTLKIYDTLGREITTLVNKQLSPGNYSVKFNGSSLPSGLYLYKLTTANYTSTRKLILLK